MATDNFLNVPIFFYLKIHKTKLIAIRERAGNFITGICNHITDWLFPKIQEIRKIPGNFH